MELNPRDYIENTLNLVKALETHFIELGERLYNIHSERLWEGFFDSYGAFLESANIKKGTASMLESVHQKYILEGGKTTEDLAGVPYSRLYTAIPLIEKKGTDGALSCAITLTRDEVLETVRMVKHGEHECVPKDDRRFAICACGKFFEYGTNKINGEF